jgi:hypothetical protein
MSNQQIERCAKLATLGRLSGQTPSGNERIIAPLLNDPQDMFGLLTHNILNSLQRLQIKILDGLANGPEYPDNQKFILKIDIRRSRD